jgi:hypothetical protein
MKNLFMYLTFVSLTIFGFWVSFTWDIPVDNQLGMLFFSCMCLGCLILMIGYDIKEMIKKVRGSV